MSNVITEPYNSLLTLKYLAENVTATVMLDNQALQNICLYSLKLKHNSHGDLNQLVSQVMSGVTTSLRYPGQLNADLRKLAFNLVPFPALHFLLCNTGPLYTRSCLDYGGCSIGHLIREMFSVKNMMADCDPIRGRYLAVAGIFRGEKVQPASSDLTIQLLLPSGFRSLKSKWKSLYADTSATTIANLSTGYLME